MRGFTFASATLISFSQQSLFLFFVLMFTIIENDCSQRYVVTNGMRISRAFLAIRGYAEIWRHQNVESVVVLKSCCWTWLSCSPMISSRYSSFKSAVATLNTNAAGFTSVSPMVCGLPCFAIRYATSYDAVKTGWSMGIKPKTDRVASLSNLALFSLNSASVF